MTTPHAVHHLYVHVPFCRRRCSYCDFAIAVRREIPEARFVETVLREMRHRGEQQELGSLDLETLYFGGGTPSLLSPRAIGQLIDGVTVRSGAEITLEVNPDDVSKDRAGAWRSLGVTRVSLGVQSFHSRVLMWMHRTHDAGQAEAAIGILRDAGFENVDL